MFRSVQTFPIPLQPFHTHCTFTVKDKFQCMLFRAEFESQADTIRDGTKMLIQACNSVKESDKRYDIVLKGSSSDTIPAVLVVDSSQRDRSLHENPGHYRFQLISGYRDVISIEIIQANIPHSFFSINNNNNKILFVDDEGTYTAEIALGNYNDADILKAATEDSLNNTSSDIVFTVFRIINQIYIFIPKR